MTHWRWLVLRKFQVLSVSGSSVACLFDTFIMNDSGITMYEVILLVCDNNKIQMTGCNDSSGRLPLIRRVSVFDISFFYAMNAVFYTHDVVNSISPLLTRPPPVLVPLCKKYIDGLTSYFSTRLMNSRHIHSSRLLQTFLRITHIFLFVNLS